MKATRLQSELETAAEALGLKVVYERMRAGAPGGLCRVRGEYRVIIDRRAQTVDRISILLESIAQFPVENVFLPPEVRRAVEDRQAARVAEGRAEAAVG